MKKYFINIAISFLKKNNYRVYLRAKDSYSKQNINITYNSHSKLNRSEIAKALNISPQYASMILSGKRKGKKYKEYIALIKKQNPKAV